MKSNRHLFITYTAVLAAILLASCVKDELYNTPHPDSGAVVVTADWSDRNSDTDIPQTYILSIDGQEQEVSGETNVLNRLLSAGKYTLAAYNKPDQVTVANNTASVNATSAKHINPMPGYLFASVQDINVVADDTLRVTARMKQLIRRLNLELTATEGDYSRVQSATATLSGVASVADMATGERSAAAQVTNTFIQDGNKFTLFFRLLGIVTTEAQTLTVDITFNNGDTQQIVSDVTESMKNFNNEAEPIKLKGNLLLPVEATVTGATITGWNEVDGGAGDAN
mgnify:FL=1